MTQTAPIPRAESADHLLEVLNALYPPPCWIALPATAPTRQRSRRQHLPEALTTDPEAELVDEYLIAPGLRRPRLLLPAPARLAAGGLRSIPRRSGRAGQLRLALSVPALALGGAARLLLRDRVRVYGPPDADSLPRLLPTALSRFGAQIAGLALHIGGPRRANRKPVLALLDPAGRAVSYGKLGVSELARGLVRNERAALRALAGSRMRHTRLPRLLHARTWHDHELILQSALPTPDGRRARPRRGGTDVAALSMGEVARSCGVYHGRLAGSPYWSALRRRIGAITSPGVLPGVAERLLHVAGEIDLWYGAWHGDWTVWNSCQLGDQMLVWDWERFALGVPLGFDALHCRLTVRLASGGLTVPEVLAADEVLAPFGVGGRRAAVTAALHLLEIGTRYAGDGQRTVAAAAVTGRLLPALAAHLDAGHLGPRHRDAPHSGARHPEKGKS